MLVRREFWEHRGLWIAPAAVAGLLIVVALIGTGQFRVGRDVIEIQEALLSLGSGFYANTARAVGFVLLIVSGSTVASYLMDCLYSERKDRSILFWKSMPVSDRDAVLAKFATAMLVVPVYVYALTVLTHLLCSAIVLARATATFGPPSWGWGSFLQVIALVDGQILVRLTAQLLWYAPLAAWMLLASAVARRSPYLYAVLPPVLLVIAERLVLGTNHVLGFIGERFAPGGRPSHGFDLGGVPLLGRTDLWLGLLAAAVMIAIAIRLRRYRDDT
jgi:ABC-2 type transport system permease protein